MSALDVLPDQQMRTHVYDQIQQVLRNHDLLVTATLGVLPVDNATDGNTVGPSSIEGVEVDPLIGWCLTYLLNFTGHPAASVPAGDIDGLPVGMQLIGRRYGDADVLAASGAFERLRPWQDAFARCAARPRGCGEAGEIPSPVRWEDEPSDRARPTGARQPSRRPHRRSRVRM